MTAQPPTMTTYDDMNDALAAYALGALERHLETCARCRDDLAPFTRVADSLAFAPLPSSPPPDLRSRLLTEAQGQTVQPPVAPQTTVPASPTRAVLTLPRWVVFPAA